MAWLPNGEKNFDDMFIHFDKTHKRDRQTDRHHMTAKAALDASIVLQKTSYDTLTRNRHQKPAPENRYRFLARLTHNLLPNFSGISFW